MQLQEMELTGMPCKHVVACIWFMQENGEDFDIPERWVHKCYWLSTWKKVYAFNIEPISSRNHWPQSDRAITLTARLHLGITLKLGGPKRREEIVQKNFVNPL